MNYLRLLRNPLMPIVLAAMFALLACSSTAPQSPTAQPAASQPTAAKPASTAPTAAPAAAQATAPAQTAAPAPAGRKPEGSLLLTASNFAAENWNPAIGSSQDFMLMLPYEYLVDYRPDTYTEIPMLAEKFDMSPDGMNWTFSLRKGVQFQGGYGEFTADDVKFTYDLIVGKDSKSSLASWYRQYVKSLEIVNPYQVVFHMASPNFSLPYRVGNQQPVFPMVSKKYFESVGPEKAGRQPIGTGPYKLVDHKAGQSLTFEAVDTHYRQVPYYKTVTIKLTPEEATRVAMLKAGEADVIQITPALAPDVKKAGLNIMEMPAAYGENIFYGGLWVPEQKNYNPNLPWVGPDPAKALKVRQAMALAVNKDEIISQVLNGMAKPMTVYLAIPGADATNPALKPYPFDPAKAKQLLAEAGYPNGFDVGNFEVFTITGRPTVLPVAEAVANYWSQIGIKSKLTPLEQPTWLAEWQARKSLNMYSWANQLGGGDPSGSYSNLATTKSQYAIFESYELDKMIQRNATNMDAKSRNLQWQETFKYIYDNNMNFSIAAVSNVFGVSKKVGKWPVPLSAPPFIHVEYITP